MVMLRLGRLPARLVRSLVRVLGKKRAIVFLQLPQDLDLALPLATELLGSGIETRALATSELLERSPRVASRLADAGVPLRSFPSKGIRAGLVPWLGGVGALVCPTESTAGPHRIAHFLTRRARALGIPTYTLQHGFDNIGLTYFDGEFPPGAVSFASETIFLWGPLSTLHPDVPPETRARCLPTGLLKAIEPSPGRPDLVSLSAPGTRPVAIFENLHWSRYSRRYRDAFMRDVRDLALAAHSRFTFFIKPHHAGRWLTREERNVGGEGLVVLDPSDPKWEPHTAPDLIASASAVVTTPSTVAVDAALSGTPVAVAGYDADVSRYEPLPILRTHEDWRRFLDETSTREAREALVTRAVQFLDRWVLRGNGARRAAETVASRFGRAPARAALEGARHEA